MPGILWATTAEYMARASSSVLASRVSASTLMIFSDGLFVCSAGMSCASGCLGSAVLT